jgi:amidohydrolase
MRRIASFLLTLCLFTFLNSQSQSNSSPSANLGPILASIDQQAAKIMTEVIAWRRQLHQHPELSMREFNTSKFVAEKLKAMGLEVHTGVAKTGVVALLKGGKPGPVVACAPM